jgi:hypothetical protein
MDAKKPLIDFAAAAILQQDCRVSTMPDDTDDDPVHNDATTAFLFQCGESDVFAVSRDRSGANIPTTDCVGGWLLRETFLLGVREPVPAAIEPEPILRGIAADGYFIWSAGTMHGTSQ